MVIGTGDAVGAEAARRLARLAAANARVGRIGPGLTDAEFARVEGAFGFEFATDHRAFLAAGLPLNVPVTDPPGVISAYRAPWPDWRDGDPDDLRERLRQPVAGVLFDVENNGYWHESWGDRPAARDQKLQVAQEHLAYVPTLVPIYGHRYLPARRDSAGHLVLSVHQTDIISYGDDLADYVEHEFGQPRPTTADRPRATVEFWRDLL